MVNLRSATRRPSVNRLLPVPKCDQLLLPLVHLKVSILLFRKAACSCVLVIFSSRLNFFVGQLFCGGGVMLSGEEEGRRVGGGVGISLFSLSAPVVNQFLSPPSPPTPPPTPPHLVSAPRQAGRAGIGPYVGRKSSFREQEFSLGCNMYRVEYFLL